MKITFAIIFMGFPFMVGVDTTGSSMIHVSNPSTGDASSTPMYQDTSFSMFVAL